MKAYVAYAIAFLIAFALIVQPAMAITQMAIPFIDSGDFIYTGPTEYSNLVTIEYNNVQTASASACDLNIDFPALADGVHIGPASAAGTAGADGARSVCRASANMLPFGPVSLAFPSISQSASNTYEHQRTYFYSDVG